jgi:hypothetical protein
MLAARNLENPAGSVDKTVPSGSEGLSSEQRRKVVVRSHSKAIYFYPTLLVALLCGFRLPADGSGAWGNLFLTVFLANLLVVMFEFNSLKVLLLSLTGLVLGLAVFSFGMIPWISEHLAQVHHSMNRQGYFLYAGFFGALIFGDVVWAHLNRWEFAANDVKHIQVFTGRTANFPGRGLRFQVHTVDVWERLLLGAGTLLLSLGGKKVEIQNVPLVRGKVQELEKFVRSAGVFNDAEDVFDGFEDEED